MKKKSTHHHTGGMHAAALSDGCGGAAGGIGGASGVGGTAGGAGGLGGDGKVGGGICGDGEADAVSSEGVLCACDTTTANVAMSRSDECDAIDPTDIHARAWTESGERRRTRSMWTLLGRLFGGLEILCVVAPHIRLC